MSQMTSLPSVEQKASSGKSQRSAVMPLCLYKPYASCAIKSCLCPVQVNLQGKSKHCSSSCPSCDIVALFLCPVCNLLGCDRCCKSSRPHPVQKSSLLLYPHWTWAALMPCSRNWMPKSRPPMPLCQSPTGRGKTLPPATQVSCFSMCITIHTRN